MATEMQLQELNDDDDEYHHADKSWYKKIKIKTIHPKSKW